MYLNFLPSHLLQIVIFYGKERKFRESDIFFYKTLFLGSYIVLVADLKANSLDGLLDIYQRDKDIIQQSILAKTEETLGRGNVLS